MSIWSDNWEWAGPTINEGDGDGQPGENADRMYEVRGVVLHIAEGSYAGTIAWQHNADAEVSSHFVHAKDGRRAQVVDTADRAWTQSAGNGHWLSIENEGFHWEALTDAQVEAAAMVLARAHTEYGVPLVSTDDPAGRGLGWHGMGGAAWGGHYDCPGEQIKAQRPAIIARAEELVGGDDMAGEGPEILARVKEMQEMWLTTPGNRNSFTYWVRKVIAETLLPQVLAAVKALQETANRILATQVSDEDMAQIRADQADQLAKFEADLKAEVDAMAAEVEAAARQGGAAGAHDAAQHSVSDALHVAADAVAPPAG